VVLLVDVLLVILYFVLASGAEGGKILPSAGEETFVLFLVFLVYVVWDALTKLGMGKPAGYWVRRGWITWACTLLTLLVWACHRHVTHPRGVIITDAILILIVLTFRAFKDKRPGEPSSVLGRVLRGVLLGATVGFSIVTCFFPSIMRGQG
jgi:hypothetical protein